jgi:hypothetical protein
MDKDFLEDPSSLHLLLAHNGGASDHASFGWCIATPNFILWEGSGLTQGRTPGSFHAESYGMLAALRFLLQHAHYNSIPPRLIPLEPSHLQFHRLGRPLHGSPLLQPLRSLLCDQIYSRHSPYWFPPPPKASPYASGLPILRRTRQR